MNTFIYNKISLSRLLLPLLFFALHVALTVLAADGSCLDENAIQMKMQVDPFPKAKKIILSINAANSHKNWERVNTLVDGSEFKWEIQELILPNFGEIMHENSFTAALEKSYYIMKETLERLQPHILLASSKGVGAIAYLASKGLWIERPVIFFSPIPNPIGGLVSGSSYEMEWSDTINIIKHHNIRPVLVVAGSSIDEEMFISEALQEPSACGLLDRNAGTFDNCKDWRHVVVSGDHSWSSLPQNEVIISKLIDYAVLWIEKDSGNSRNTMIG